MKFPMDMFPVLFAIGRTPGWLAQWQEMLLDKEQKIARPHQIYTGPEQRDTWRSSTEARRRRAKTSRDTVKHNRYRRRLPPLRARTEGPRLGCSAWSGLGCSGATDGSNPGITSRGKI